MSEDPPLPAVDRDFEAIEAAVLQTDRGRWFLSEYGRRNRVADTRLLLDAISRLGSAVGEPEAAVPTAPKADWPEIERSFDAARTALAVDGLDATLPLSRLFGRMIRVSRSASADILDAVERVQEAAWSLREAGADPTLCDDLDGCAARILQSSAEGAITDERASAVRDALGAVEERLDILRRRRLGRAAEGAEPIRPPERADSGEAESPAPALREPAAATRPIPPALAAIDAIDFRQRLKLFT